MAKITEFYRCFGCGREHDLQSDAISCCAVAQHIWRCEHCGEEFASEAKAASHIEKIYDGAEKAINMTAALRSVPPSARFAWITQ